MKIYTFTYVLLIIKILCMDNDILYDIFDRLSAIDAYKLSLTNKKIKRIYNKIIENDFRFRLTNVQLFVPPNKFCSSSRYVSKPLNTSSKNIKYVLQREMSIISNERKDYEYVGSIGIATCIVLAGFCSNLTFVIHFDDSTNVDKTIILLNTQIQSQLTKGSEFKFWITGGFITYSERLFSEIDMSIKRYINFKYNIVYDDVLESLLVKSMAINTLTGEYFDYILDPKFNSKEKIRQNNFSKNLPQENPNLIYDIVVV